MNVYTLQSKINDIENARINELVILVGQQKAQIEALKVELANKEKTIELQNTRLAIYKKWAKTTKLEIVRLFSFQGLNRHGIELHVVAENHRQILQPDNVFTYWGWLE